jgi:hypothetical protein
LNQNSCATALHVAAVNWPEWAIRRLHEGGAVHRFDLSDDAANALRRVSNWLRNIERVSVAGHPEQFARTARDALRGLGNTSFSQALDLADAWREARAGFRERHTDQFEDAEVATRARRKWALVVNGRELGDVGDTLGMCFGWNTPLTEMRDRHHADLTDQRAAFWILRDRDGSPLAAVKVRLSPHYVEEAKASGNVPIGSYRREVQDLLVETGAAADPYEFKGGLDEDCKDDLAAVGMLEPAVQRIDNPDQELDDGTKLWIGRYVAVIRSHRGTWWRLRWTRSDRTLGSCLTRFPSGDAGPDVERVGRMMAAFLNQDPNAFWLSGYKVHLADELTEFVDGKHWRSAVQSTKQMAGQIFHRLPKGVFIELDNSPTLIIERRGVDRRRIEVLDKTPDFASSVDNFADDGDQVTFWKWVDPEATRVHGLADIESDYQTQEPSFGVVPTPAGWKSTSHGWDAHSEEGGISYRTRWVLDVTPQYKGFEQRLIGRTVQRSYALQIGGFNAGAALTAGTLRWRSARRMEFDFAAPGRTPSAAAKLLDIGTAEAQRNGARLDVNDLPVFVHRGDDGSYVGAVPARRGATPTWRNFHGAAIGFDDAGHVLWTAPMSGDANTLGLPRGYDQGWERAAIEAVMASHRTVDDDWTALLCDQPFIRNANGGIDHLPLAELYAVRFGDVQARRDRNTDQIAWTISDQVSHEFRLAVVGAGCATFDLPDEELDIERTDDLRRIVSAILDVGGLSVEPLTLAWLGLQRTGERHVEIGEAENHLCGDRFDVAPRVSWVRDGRDWATGRCYGMAVEWRKPRQAAFRSGASLKKLA